jgi:hypothetical protein
LRTGFIRILFRPKCDSSGQVTLQTRIVASEDTVISAELKKIYLKDVMIGLTKAWENEARTYSKVLE